MILVERRIARLERSLGLEHQLKPTPEEAQTQRALGAMFGSEIDLLMVAVEAQ